MVDLGGEVVSYERGIPGRGRYRLLGRDARLCCRDLENVWGVSFGV